MESRLATLPSPELLQRLNVLVRRDRATEAELLAHLGEVDARRLYLEEACSSMYQYCVRTLHFAEAVALERIQVARASRRHPELLEAIRRGSDRGRAPSRPPRDPSAAASRAAGRRALLRPLHRRRGDLGEAEGAARPDASPGAGRRRGEDPQPGGLRASGAGAQQEDRGLRAAEITPATLPRPEPAGTPVAIDPHGDPQGGLPPRRRPLHLHHPHGPPLRREGVHRVPS